VGQIEFLLIELASCAISCGAELLLDKCHLTANSINQQWQLASDNLQAAPISQLQSRSV